MTNIVQKLTINGKSIDGVLGIRTWDCIMVGEDESTELWQPTLVYIHFYTVMMNLGSLTLRYYIKISLS